MKNLLKRSMAFLLVLCMLLSYVPHTTLAVADNNDGTYTYTFAYNIASGNERPTLSSAKFTGDFVAVARNNSNVKTSATTLQFQSTATKGDWYALEFEVGKTGYFDIQLALNTQQTGTDVLVDLHVVPTSALVHEAGNEVNQTYIDGLTPACSAALLKSTKSNPTIEGFHFETTGKYLLIIEMASDPSSVVNFTGFTMTDVSEKMAERIAFIPTHADGVYTYTWAATADDRASNGYPTNYTGYYGNFAGYALSGSTMYKPYDAYMQIQSARTTGYIALRINVPAAGNYNVTFDISGGARIMDVFFVDPVNMTTGTNVTTNNEYIAALTGNHRITVGSGVETLTNVNFATAGDYVMIWRMADGSATGNVNFYGMTMTKIMTDQDKADLVIEKINAIGEVTLDDEEAITAARAAYDALTETQKALVTNIDTLIAAETSLNALKADKAAAQAVIDQIAAIGEVTLDDEEAITAARAAYDALTDPQKALVTNIDTLTAAEATLDVLLNPIDPADQAAADAVIEKINAIGTVTLGSETTITEARTAYDALTDTQKALVGENIDTLTDAETALATLKQEAADQAAAQAVIDKIAAIGTVTLGSETAITEARAAYNALTDTQKALVTNYTTLTDAEAALASLKQEAAIQAVIDKIAAIGEVTLEDETAIAEARAAYNALSNAQKAQVTNYADLQTAELAFINLSNPNPNPSTFDGTVYDFTTMADILGATNGSSKNLLSSKDALDAAFTAGNINYTYYGAYSIDVTGADAFGTAQLWTNYNRYAGCISVKMGDYAGAWVAMKVKVPAAGTYKFQFTYPDNYTTNLSTRVDAFMLPVSVIENAVTAEKTAEMVINELLAAGTYAPVASKDVKTATNGGTDDADFWGNVNITSTEDHVVIFRATENKHGGTSGTSSNLWMFISGFNLTNPPSEQDIAAAESVQNMIAAIGKVVRDSQAEIEAARAAYEALTDKQKALVENLSTLEEAETRLAELLDDSNGIEYIYKNKDNITTNNYPAGIGLSYADFVDYARATTVFKVYPTYIQTQTSFSNGRWFALKFDVAQAGDYDLALSLAKSGSEAVELEVYFVRADALNKASGNEDNQTFIDGLASDASVKKYTVKLLDNTTWNLTGVQLDQDAYVVIFKNVSDAAKFNFYGLTINRTGDYTGPAKDAVDPEDQAAAQVVIDQIAAIGTVTLNSEEAINAARAAYDALKPKQQALVTNYDVLTAAEATLAQLKFENAVADTTAKINAIGTVTLDSYAAIKAARDAYNALTEGQKAEITNYQTLLDAEAKIAELRNPNPDKNTFDGYVFDFTDAFGLVNCTDGKNASFVTTTLADAYANGTLNFNAIAGSSTPYLWNNYSNFPNTVGAMVGGYAGAWLAVQVKAPETGSYRFQFYYPAKYHTNLSAKVDAYMIPMSAINSAVTADKTADVVISELLAAGTYAPVASKNVKTATAGNPADEDDFWGNVTLTKGEEYAVIFRATENKHGGTDPTVTTSNVWLVISGFSLGNPPTEQDIAAAQSVTDKIAAIGVVTAGSKAEIEAARAAYDALTDKQKDLVENYNLLVAAEERLAQILDTSDGIEYIYKDPGNPTLPNGYPSGIGYTFGDFVDYARSNVTAFKPLAQNIQTQAGYTNGKWFGLMFDVAQAGNYDLDLNIYATKNHAVTLDVYFVRADSLNKANGDEENQAFIDGLATNNDVKTYKVDLADETTWKLSGVQLDKDAYVIIFKNTAGLKPEGAEKAENTMFNFKGFIINRTGNYTGPVKEDTSAQDNAAAKVVIDLINAIGTVTLDSEEAINAAREAYEALKVRQQKLVTNYQKLLDAETAFAQLKYDNAVADVMAKINAIGEVTLNSNAAIMAAREAYNALDDGQKAEVTNYQTLLDAEAKIAVLRNPNPDKNTFDGFVFDFTDAKDILNCTDGKNATFGGDKLAEAYTNGTLNFNALGASGTPYLWNNFKNYRNTIGVVVQGHAGAWVATSIKAPATGTFRFQFTYPSVYSVNLSTKVDAYMIPMSVINSAVTADKTADVVIGELLASGNYAPVASKNVKGAIAGNPADEDDFWGNVQVKKGVEYAVIFRATENKHGGTDPTVTTSNVWLVVSGFSLGYPATEQDIAAAGNVDNMISAIGKVVRGSKAEIEAARAAYEALTDKQKGLVESLSVLVAAEERLADILDTSDGIEYLYKNKDNITDTGYPAKFGLTYADFVDYARSGTSFKVYPTYIQTQSSFGNGSWFGLMFNVDQAADYDLSLDISSRNAEVILDVYFVRADAMNKALKDEDNQTFVDGLANNASVKKYTVNLLDKATWNLSDVQLDEDAYVVIFKNVSDIRAFNFYGFTINRTGDYTGPVREDTSVEDKAAAKTVIDLINAIGTVTLNSGDAITAAREAYDALRVRQQKLVTNYQKLLDAEALYAQMKYDNAVADTIAKIDAIGTVTLNSYEAIKAARDAYNSLDAGQKTEVTNYQKLLDAEAKIVLLRNPNPNKDTFDGFVFDFTDAKDILNCTDGRNATFGGDALAEAYANGTLNFGSVGGSGTSYLWNNYSNYRNTIGVVVQGYAGAWFAAKVNAPATGTYRFQFYYPAAYNVNLSTKVDAYMIPMSAIDKALKGDATVESVVESLIDSGKYAPVASKNVKKATNGGALDEDDFWGNVKVTKDTEYAVIFRATENKHGGTNPEVLTSNVWLAISGFSLATPPTEADLAAAQDVMSKIDAIGVVTRDSAETIKAARKAYDALTEKQKALVENYSVLLAAEERLADILDESDYIEYIYKDPGYPKNNGYPTQIGLTYGDFIDYARAGTIFKPYASYVQTQSSFGNGKWYAMSFVVDQAGDYDLNLKATAVRDSAVTLDVYFVRADSLLKGSGNAKNQEFVDGLASNKDVKTYKVDLTDKSTLNLTGVQLDKDVYVVIFKNTSDEKMFNFSGFNITRTGDYTGPAKVIEQPLPDPDTDKLVYDFYYGGVASGTKLFDKDLLELMNKEYAMNKQNWIPFAVKVNTVIVNKYSATYLDGTGDRYPWTGTLLSSGVGEWIAFQIKAPGTGTYDLTLEHAKNINGSTTGKVYVIPVSALKDNSVETIDAAIADDTYKLINSASFRGNDPAAVTELGQAEFEKGKDYVVVIMAAKNKHGSENPFEINATTGANELYEAFILANKLTVTKFVAPDPLNVKEVVYNFFREDFAYGTNVFSENALGTLMTEYIKGNSYWKPYASTVGTSFDIGSATYVNLLGKRNLYEGIMTNSYVGEMLGIQIKSPGTGMFNVELTYGLTVNGSNDGEIYFVPLSKLNGDLSNMDKFIESGEYKLQRDISYKTGYADNKYRTTLVGQVNLEYGEEYVVVFRAASNKHGSASTVMADGSPYQAYMILQEMKLTKTNTVIDNFEDPEPEAPDVSGQADPEAAAAVMALIDAIGDEITLASASAISTARTAYDLLTENQKALVTNYQKLLDAEAKLAELVTADDKAKADAVIAKIDAIGEVTLEAEGRIVAARIAYTLLTNAQRALVTNYATLLAAEAKLAELKGESGGSALDQASADAVAALIDKIGTVTLDSEMYISAARNAYNALTDAQKLLVDNYATLVAAERVFAELKAAQDAAIAEEEAAKRKTQQITIMIVAAVIAAVAAGVVAIFAVPGLREKFMLFLAKFKKGEKK